MNTATTTLQQAVQQTRRREAQHTQKQQSAMLLSEFDQAERTIEEILQALGEGVKVAKAGARIGAELAAIQAGRGWQTYTEHHTWTEYLRHRWHYEPAVASEMMDQARAQGLVKVPAAKPAPEPQPGPEPTPQPSTEPETRVVPLDQLIVDREVQLQTRGTDEPTIERYKEAMQAGAKFPALLAYQDEEGALWLADGFHRRAALYRAGYDRAKVEVHSGTRQDAILYAATANVAHGRAMSRAEKQEAGERLIQLTDWPDREIARRLGVSHPTVGRWREVLAMSGKLSGTNVPDSETRTVTRGGQTYEMNVEQLQAEGPTREDAEQAYHAAQALHGDLPPASHIRAALEVQQELDEPSDEELEAALRARQEAQAKAAAERRAARQRMEEARTVRVNCAGGGSFDLPLDGGEASSVRPFPKPGSGKRKPRRRTSQEFDQIEMQKMRLDKVADILRRRAANLGYLTVEIRERGDEAKSVMVIDKESEWLRQLAEFAQYGAVDHRFEAWVYGEDE